MRNLDSGATQLLNAVFMPDNRKIELLSGQLGQGKMNSYKDLCQKVQRELMIPDFQINVGLPVSMHFLGLGLSGHYKGN